MKIRTKLALNTAALVIISGVIVVAGLLALSRVKEKVKDLTERSTPYQMRTLDFERSIQGVMAALTKASAARTTPELQADKAAAAKAVAEMHGTEKALAAISASDSTKISGELTTLADGMFPILEESLTANDSAAEASRQASTRLAESSQQLKDLDARIRALQLNRMAVFMTKLEEAKNTEEVRNSPAITQSSIATNCLLGNSELVWLGAIIDARAQRLLSARNVAQADSAAQEIREAFDKLDPAVTYLEKMLKKIDAQEELRILGTVKASMDGIRPLLLSEQGAVAKITRNLEIGAKVEEVNQRISGIVARHTAESRTWLSSAHSDQEKTVFSVNGLVQRTTLQILVLGIVATLVGFVSSVVLALGIAQPIREFAAMAARFGSGDFTMRMDQHRKDEFGAMASDFNAAAEKIGSMVGQIASASDSLARGASELSTTTAVVSEDAGTISSLIARNAANAGQTNDRMKSARSVIQAANGSMTELANATQEMAESSRAAQNIVKTINEIAFKTNLLSLNAAIEAARAGNVGAGFEVVANEVRTLARQTAEAAHTTTDLIGEIASKTNRSTELAQTTRTAFAEVESLTSDVETFIDAIAASSHDQELRIQAINEQAATLGQVSNENAAAAEELASSMSCFRVVEQVTDALP